MKWEVVVLNETIMSALNSSRERTSIDIHNTANTQVPLPENWLG